jgi:hypothetical protein
MDHVNNPKRTPSREIEFRANMAHSHRTFEIADIGRQLAAGTIREIAIVREVGDSVRAVEKLFRRLRTKISTR